jgi:MFS family permease
MNRLSRAARLYLVYAALLTFGLAVAALLFNLALVELGYDQRTIALPLVGERSLLGVLNSLPVAVAALSSLPLWYLVSVIGPRPALIIGAFLHALSLLVVALRPEPLPLLIGGALGGPAAVLVQVSAAPLMMRQSTSAERDLLFSLNAGINLGVAGIGSLAGGLLPGILAAWFGLEVAAALPYRAAFVVASMCVALAALPLLLPAAGAQVEPEMIRPDAEPLAAPAPVRYPRRNWRTLAYAFTPAADGPRAAALAWLGALRFMVSPLLISFGAALLIPFLNLYFRQRFGAPDAQLGLIFAAIGIVTGLATLGAPLLSARLGKMGSVVFTQALAVPCLLLLGVAPTLGLAVLVALARGALMNMAAPLYDAYAMERSPAPARPIVIGLINGAFAAGYIVGPTISAEVQRTHGFGPLFIATACCYTLAVSANALLFLRRAPRENAVY